MNDQLLRCAIGAAERGLLPETLVRLGIRGLCRERLREARGAHSRGETEAMVRRLSRGPVALHTREANRQHYEVPAEVFVHTLGPRLKYSCCYWPDSVATLSEAEEAALAETCRRAGIADGMEVLDLGCGWGSLALWMAETYPASRITAVSNSRVQRLFIEERTRRAGLENLDVVTADINDFRSPSKFDRVVSVEMFEHMRNYRELLARISGWLTDHGRLFVHVFAHRTLTYEYESGGGANWMADNFFTGGIMPSRDLLPGFQGELSLVSEWWWDGSHYRRTAEAWLRNMASNRRALVRTFAESYGAGEATRWYRRWKLFYMACSELWGYRGGAEWGVGHYLFERSRRMRHRQTAGLVAPERNGISR